MTPPTLNFPSSRRDFGVGILHIAPNPPIKRRLGDDAADRTARIDLHRESIEIFECRRHEKCSGQNAAESSGCGRSGLMTPDRFGDDIGRDC